MTMVMMKTMMNQVGFITESVKSQYDRIHLGNGIEVYVFTGVPKHYACPHCFHKESIQVLRYRRIASGFFECPACKNTFPATFDKGLFSPIMNLS
jgi:hypothetical protein